MEINKVGSRCPPVMGSALRACLGLLEGKDPMCPRGPSVGLFPPFLLTAPLSGRIRTFFFFPPVSFCLPLEENSIVLFLVMTTWLLATTSFCCRRCRRARGDGWEWPHDARDAASTSSSSPGSRLFLWPLPWWLDQLLDQLLAGMNRCHLHPTRAQRGAERPGVPRVWRRHLTTCLLPQLGAPRGIFGSLVPSCQGHEQQLACWACSAHHAK